MTSLYIGGKLNRMRMDETKSCETPPSVDSYPRQESEPRTAPPDLEGLKGRFEFDPEIIEGGMGLIYRARDLKLGRIVAIKELKTRSNRRALGEEAMAMARLSHPNIVQIFDFVEVENREFIIMEYVDGGTLSEWLDERPRVWQEVVRVYIQAGRGLEAVHQRGLVHRDFKPLNVLIDRGVARLIDFGLAQDVDSQCPGSRCRGYKGRSDTMAHAGSGTPGYRSPEQARADKTVAASDIFTFCTALCRSLVGDFPFPSGEDRSSAIQRGEVEFDGPKTPIPRNLKRAIRRGLAFSPEDRWPSMGALLSALESCLRAHLVFRRNLLFGFMAVGIILIGKVGGARLSKSEPRHVDGLSCMWGSAEIDELWDEDARKALESAFFAEASPLAEQHWTMTSGLLDRYADSWRRVRAEVCGYPTGDQATSHLRVDASECLSLRLNSFRDAVRTLRVADDASMRGAPTVVADLPPVAFCLENEAMKTNLEPPAGLGGRLVDRAIRSWGAQAMIREASGDGLLGVELATIAVNVADALSYRPAQAEAYFTLGVLQRRAATYGEAEESLQRSVMFAEASRHDEVAANAWMELMKLSLALSDGRESLVRSRRVWASVERAGPARRRRGEELVLEAIALATAGDDTEAHVALEQGIDSLERTLASGADPLWAAGVYNNVAVAYRRLGLASRAYLAYRTALQLYEEASVEVHPRLVEIHLSAALVLVGERRLAEAVEHEETAVSMSSLLYGEFSEDVADVYLSMADRLLLVGESELALPRALVAGEILDETLPDDVSYRSIAHTSAAIAYGRLGLLAEATVAAERAARLASETSSDVEMRVVTLVNLADALVKQGDVSRAAKSAAQARALINRTPGDRARLLGAHVDVLDGAIAISESRPDEASPVLRRALGAFVDDGVDDDFALAEAALLLARTETGAQAQHTHEQAVALFLESGSDGARLASRVRNSPRQDDI